MSTVPMLSLVGMYNYDNTLFDNLTFPSGISKDTFVDALLVEKGEMPVLYSSIEFNKQAFGVWSKKWDHSFSRLYRAFTEEYDPLHNFDRHEEYKDTEKTATTDQEKGNAHTKGSTRTNADISNTVTNNSTKENKISAYNESDYQPKDLVTDAANGSTVTDESRETETDDHVTNTVDRTGNEDRTLEHSAHLYGNIGVTKSTEMLRDEYELRSRINLYDAIIEIFADEFLIGVY